MAIAAITNPGALSSCRIASRMSWMRLIPLYSPDQIVVRARISDHVSSPGALICAGPQLFAAGQAQPLSAAEIMKKVAENQDREQKTRAGFLYEQDIRVDTRRTNGKLAREERATLLVTPTPKGVDKKRQSITGRYWYKGRYLVSPASQFGAPIRSMDSSSLISRRPYKRQHQGRSR